ncbi:hypothetical protein Tsubulata_029290 [Turnera subulata]|uniref:Kinesin motor domain-containing protein n=1 Tax=Turnera subulata TaxID=218843 RepID=A0A9Q0JCB0_9ROSI|nr:hypothetical protein Tsubulata_029290 [Turnera subulata]
MERKLLLSSLCLKQGSTEIIKYDDQSECDTEDQLNLQEMHFGTVDRPLTEISKCNHIICMPSYSQGNGCWSNGSAANLSFMRFFNLVDLPDSERQRRLGYVGEHFEVNAKSYKSSTVFRYLNHFFIVPCFKTSTLAAVAVAPWKPKYIPHRDSKISFCLKELLGRNSKSQIIWDVKRSICSSSKTLDSLKFAQQAKLIENKAMLGEKDQEKDGDSSELGSNGIIAMPTEQAMTQNKQLDQLVHQAQDAFQMESIPAFSLMKCAEEILGLQLELHIWNIIREEKRRPIEATRELKEAKSVIEALKLQQIQASAEMEDLKERNSHYCSLLSEKDLQICGLKDRVEEITVGFSRDLQMAKEELDSMNKQLCAATRELKRVKSVSEASKSQNSIATYKIEDLQKSNRNYLNLLVEKDAEISALKKQHCRKEIIDLCEEHEEEEEQLPCNSELLAQNQELIAALHQKEEDLKLRNGLIEKLHRTILEKDARIDTIVRALTDIQNIFKGSGLLL